MKKRADALGSLVRSGVEPDSAAQVAGVSDVKFRPGQQPITLRSSDGG